MIKRRQETFDFPEEETINPPSYQRELDTKYDGISPREAFQKLSSVTYDNRKMEELAPYVITFMKFNKSKIEKLLQQISAGVAVNAEQRNNAWKMLEEMQTQNDISNAFALWELNITPIKDERSLWPAHAEMIQRFHCLMGRFRSEMEALSLLKDQK